MVVLKYMSRPAPGLMAWAGGDSSLIKWKSGPLGARFFGDSRWRHKASFSPQCKG